MNGLHLHALPPAELSKIIADRWVSAGILTVSDGPFVEVRCFHKYCISLLPLMSYKILQALEHTGVDY